MNTPGKLLLAGLLGLCLLGWGSQMAGTTHAAAHPLWIVRQELLNLSGLLAIAMMSLAMFLASRPQWLEGPLGGLDRIYRTHKWAGILAGIFAALHWLIEEVVDDILKASIGREGRLPKEKFTGMLEVMRDLAKDLGEWGFYLLLIMLALALWRRFPYRPWRSLHRAMPLLYLALVVHAAMWAPTAYWQQPIGLLLALLMSAGVYGSVLALAGHIGRRRQVAGRIVALEPLSDEVLSVRCQLEAGWPHHQPGQFAFVTFAPAEGAHPFTIASAATPERHITFHIKALGDYTRGLARRLQVGQAVQVEGPYGRFQLALRNPRARQIWIAGGIGITPFLAWLESLRQHPDQAASAELHYCTRDRHNDPLVARLEALCATLPGITLHIHGARQGEILAASQLQAGAVTGQKTELWFCGPSGLAQQLRQGLAAAGLRYRFHQEAFEMR